MITSEFDLLRRFGQSLRDYLLYHREFSPQTIVGTEADMEKTHLVCGDAQQILLRGHLLRPEQTCVSQWFYTRALVQEV